MLGAVAGRGKVLSIHSRQVEAAVLDLLVEFAAAPAVFHWYAGPLDVLERLLAAGHYCSINPAMVRSNRGRDVITHLPRERALTETDGPFVKVGGRTAVPADVELVYQHIADAWGRGSPGSRAASATTSWRSSGRRTDGPPVAGEPARRRLTPRPRSAVPPAQPTQATTHRRRGLRSPARPSRGR